MSLQSEYKNRHDKVLNRLAGAIAEQVQEYLRSEPRIDRIIGRAKDIVSFLDKARREENGKRKYVEPLSQIQDQIGVRIITFYTSDVTRLRDLVLKYFRPIEIRNHVPESEKEFSYFGRHFILKVPTDAIAEDMDRSLVPEFFELQIKTLFQHAWSEAEHDLGYKPGTTPLTSEQKRRLAFTSAQAWGADHIFEELFRERHS
jgi:ppGpp synthetase/RelA/SpoT-type nucleotidyltranferase